MTPSIDLSDASRLRRAAATRNITVIAPVIVSILTRSPSLTMLDMEDLLRSTGSDVYLVAWPVAKMPTKLGLYPRRLDGMSTNFGLWICVNGEDDMKRELSHFGLTIAENRDALRECGFNTV